MKHIEVRNLNLNEILVKFYPNPNAKHPEMKDYKKHSEGLISQLEKNIEKIQVVSKKNKLKPQMVLKLKLEDECMLSENEKKTLMTCDLEFISNKNNQTEVIYSKEESLEKFKNIIRLYGEEVKAKTKVMNEELINKIVSIEEWTKEDKIDFAYSEINRDSYIDCYLWVFDSYDDSMNKLNEFRTSMGKVEGVRETDKYVGKAMCIVRMKITDEKAMLVLENNPLIYKIKLIKFRDKSEIESQNKKKEIMDKDVDDIKYDLSNMGDINGSVCIIDSGLYLQHPFFRGIVGEAVDFRENEDNPNDIEGHGTAVASICAYGNLENLDEFKPEIYINSAKIHDGEYIHPMWYVFEEFKNTSKNLNNLLEVFIGEYIHQRIDIDGLLKYIEKDEQPYFKMLISRYDSMYDRLYPNLMREIVRYFKGTYQCNIFNLSQGDKYKPYDDENIGEWACVLDEIQAEEDVLFVVSTGNYEFENDDFRSIKEYYPDYLFENNTRIIDPATSITSITVGGVAMSGSLKRKNRMLDCDEMIISEMDEVSSFTRVGPGPEGIIKPEFVHYAGDYAIKLNRKTEYRNSGLEKKVFSIGNNLFDYSLGTSLAAPEITHLAGLVKKRYPTASSNLIRAIIASSSEYTNEMNSISKKIFDKKSIKIKENYLRSAKLSKPKIKLNMFGYGMPNKNKALESLENRVVLYADNFDKNLINEGKIHLYEIPLPEKFRNAKGNKKIIVSLAYNPSVRNTRKDYKGSNLNFNVIRGQDVESVIRGFTKVKKGMETKIASRYKCAIEYKEEIGKGTLQKGIFNFVRNNDNFTDEVYLMIERLKGWCKDPQRYAIVVTLECEEEIDVYTEIYNRVNHKVVNKSNVVEQKIRVK